MITPRRQPATVIAIDAHKNNLPPDPTPAKACSTRRALDVEEDAFSRWFCGARPAEIAREMRIGLNCVDDAIRSNVKPIRRAA